MDTLIAKDLNPYSLLCSKPLGLMGFGLLPLLALLGGCQLADKPQTDDEKLTPSGKPIPRWEMTKSSQVNGRMAPSKEAPRQIQFQKSGLPLQVISETNDFRLVCDPKGRAYWVSANLLRPSNRAIIIGPEPVDLYQDQKQKSKIIARIKPQSLVRVAPCQEGVCKVTIDKKSGYVAQNRLWGRQVEPVCRAGFQKP